jgi:hypothetical protein
MMCLCPMRTQSVLACPTRNRNVANITTYFQYMETLDTQFIVSASQCSFIPPTSALSKTTSSYPTCCLFNFILFFFFFESEFIFRARTTWVQKRSRMVRCVVMSVW